MNSEKLNYKFLDYLIEIVSFISTFGIFLYTLIIYPKIPDLIPAKVSNNGEILDYMGKSCLWTFVVICIVMYIILSFLQKNPQSYKYTVKITEKNSKKQFSLARRTIMILKMITIIIFSVIEVLIVSITLYNVKINFSLIFFIMVLALFLTIFLYIIISKHYSKKEM